MCLIVVGWTPILVRFSLGLENAASQRLKNDTAHELVLEVYRHQEHKGGAKSRSVKPSWKEKWHSWRRAHVEFYLALGVLTFVPLFPHYHGIVIVLKELIVRLTCWISAHF